MTLFPSQQTFVRGELSPRLHSRSSLELYQAGLSKCENFVTLPHGGLRKRGGTYYVNEVHNSLRKARIIPFVFSDDQAYALELGHLILRIYAYGSRVGTVQLITPWTEDQIFQVKFVQSADVMYMVHPDHAPRILTRTAHTSWTLTEFGFGDGPFDPVNTDEAWELYASATSGSTLVTATQATFTAGMVGRLVRIDMENYTDIPPWEPNAIIDQPTLGRLRRYDGNVYECASNFGASASHDNKTGATPPTHTHGTEWDGPNSYETVPDAGAVVAPDFSHGLQWTYVHGGYGIARITGYNNTHQVAVTVLRDFPSQVVGSGDASFIWRLGAFYEGNYPDSVAIFEERLVFGRRFSIFASKTGSFSSFEIGEKADDALSFTQAGGGEANDIVWLDDTDGFLAIGTIGGMRTLSGSGIDEALTPSSFKNRRSRTMPCANIRPVNAGRSTVYVGKGRKSIAELTLGQSLRFQSEDLGQISEHIPKRGVVEIASQDYPDPFIWFPLDNGEVGGITYQASQDVRGMHRHQLGGSFSTTEWGVVESCCVTPGQTGEDEVWFIVKRTINGSTKRYIEIVTPAFEYGNIVDSFHVDCGLSREGSATGSVTGLGHLEGQTVSALADGRVFEGLTVSSGGVTLPGGATASTWHVGLPYDSSADTLELDVGGKDGSLVGRKKRVAAVYLSVLETDLSGLEIASKQRGAWEPVRIASIVPASAFASLYTGNVGPITVDDSWEGQGRIQIRHTHPTPCTIRAMTPAFDSEP